MNIVLIGYRGTGKSTVARILGERLGTPVSSLDSAIEKRTGQPIRDFVASNGWDAFREVEAACCRELASGDDLIIDAGGGVVLRPENVDRLKEHGVIVWLKADTRTIANRIGGDTSRPSLSGAKSFIDEIEDVLRERIPLYEQAAEFAVSTDDRDPVAIAGEIIKRIEGRVPAAKNGTASGT